MPNCIQVNLQQHFGGGEVYTRFLSEALITQGWEVELYVHLSADFWRVLNLEHTRIHWVTNKAEIPDRLDCNNLASTLILTHGPPPQGLRVTLQGKGKLCAIAHMPVHDRSVEGFQGLHRVFGVSRYVIETLLAKQVPHVHPEPLYGVADLRDGDPSRSLPIMRASPYDWDLRKGRTGWFYRDPRQDGGEDFRALLTTLADHHRQIDLHEAQDHLNCFSSINYARHIDPIFRATIRQDRT